MCSSDLGSIKPSGSGGALSYIQFEQGYCQRLMALGYEDAIAKTEQIRDFFELSESRLRVNPPPFKAHRRPGQSLREKFPLSFMKTIGRKPKKR